MLSRGVEIEQTGFNRLPTVVVAVEEDDWTTARPDEECTKVTVDLGVIKLTQVTGDAADDCW